MPAAILSAILLLSLAAMLYGLLRLDRTRVLILAGAVLVVYGTALYMTIDAGVPLSLAAAWTQIAALALALGGFVYAAGLAHGQRERLAESRRQLHDLQLDANARASRDALTGVYHHRHLMEAPEREIARAERIGKPLSIARVDLDWLGSINQAHGSAAGDVAPKRFPISCSAGSHYGYALCRGSCMA